MRTFLGDLRYGFRLLLKSPAFSTTAILVLGLGIGANSAVFSVIDAVLLRGLPYREPDRLVMVWEKNPTLGAFIGDRVPAAPVNVAEWQKRATLFEGIAGFEDANLNLTSGAEPERIEAARASPNFFQVLGIKPRHGTTFEFVERDPEHSHAVVVSDTYCKTHFGGATAVLGERLTLNDVVYTIVGVLPPEFHLPASREGAEQRKPQLWIPYDGSEQSNRIEYSRRKMQVFGRLRDGVSLEQARAEMESIGRKLAEEDATQNAGFGINVFPVYVEDVGKELRRNLLVLLGAVAFVLLIACANIANLILTRAAARRKEMAIRKALGAGGGRLVSQLLAEGVVVSLTGALFGLGLAYLGIKGVVALRPAGINRPEDIHLSVAVVLFTIAVSVVAALIFAMVPAWQAARTEVRDSLQETRGNSSASAGTRKALIVAEVALACILLMGAVFMIKSLVAVSQVDPGFRAEKLVTMKFSLPPSRYADNEKIAGFCHQVLEKLSLTPGVKFASFSDGLPLTRIRLTKFTVEGEPEPQRGSEPTADMRGIFNPEYFDAIGIRLLRGRNFTSEELRTHAPVLVINQTLAQKLWPQAEAIGQHLRSVPSKANPNAIVSTVIGVVGDTRQISIEEAPRPEVTKPMVDYTQLTLAVRSDEAADAIISRVKNQIWSVDRYLPVFEVRTMQQVVDETTSQRRFESFLMSLFAGLALVLATVGIYGVLASLVSQRTQEIGIRMALGAQRSDVLRLVLLEGLRLVIVGIVIGLAGGMILNRFLASLLYGVNLANPVTYIEVVCLMIAIALLACLLPAARAARVNPMVALRHE